MLAGVHYLHDDYPFKNPELRRTLAESANLDPIQGWEVCDELKHTALLSFQTTLQGNYEVIGITDVGVVWRLKDRKDFNSFLQSEGIVPRDEEGVVRTVRLLFRIMGISNIRNYNIQDGIVIINSLDDIPFGTNREREETARKVSIEKPGVLRGKSGDFVFTGYSWSKHGSGALYRRQVTFGKEGVVSVSATLIRSHIGVYAPDE
jgi:hypothetical protein